MSENVLHEFGLSAGDAEAIDRLLEHGLDPTSLEGSPTGRLLALLGTPGVGEDRALIDATFVRAVRAAEPEAVGLHPRDADALDAWVMHGYDAERTPATLRGRAARHEALAALVAATPVAAGSPGDLTDRTLAAVQGALDADAGRRRVRPGVWSRFRLADAVSVAAMLLIGVSVALPAMTAVRAGQQNLACASTMAQTASAMGLYAGAHNASLPVAGVVAGRWIDVGTPGRSNSANLFTMVRTGHATLDTLACAGNPTAARGQAAPGQIDWRALPEVSYSYRIMGRQPTAWRTDRAQPGTVVLADRSPVVIHSVNHRTIDPLAGSPNHRERGQHVLRNDGSAAWASSPVLPGGDNIWLPRAVEAAIHDALSRQGLIRGDEFPSGPDDVFLGP